jgi:hypothetical protein
MMLPAGAQVHLALGHTDMRKGIGAFVIEVVIAPDDLPSD